jgi:CARDB
MRRRLLTAIAVATAALAAAATPAMGAAKLPASVKVKDCSIENESALFIARMRQVEGSARMALRIRLLEKGESGFHLLKAPGLGRWRKSKPGVGGFAYKQAVRGLESGSLYRAAVDYRWYDDKGAVVATTHRRSAPCRQYDVLPNLTAAPVSVKAMRQAGVVRYRVLVTNEGIATATGVPVRLSVDGNVVDTVTVPQLLPAERRTVSILGPACVDTVKVEVDPDGVIVESAESDNARELACGDLAPG